MNMPSKISTWLLIVYFLLVGVTAFGVAIPAIVTGIVALATAVLLFLDK
jgi:hypothetical protein